MAELSEAIRPDAAAASEGKPNERIAAARGTWARLGHRERRLVTVGAIVLGTLLLWALAIRPAWNAMREAHTRLPALDTQLQDMQRLAVESKELRGAPKIQPSQATAALKTATDTLGPVGKLSLAGDRATLTLSNANGDQLKRWLVDARTTARARTVEAKLSRSAAGYSGTVVVALPSN